MQRIVPLVDVSSLPESQQSAARAVDYALAGLDYYALNFKAALDLFDSCKLHLRKHTTKESKKWRDWQFIAARDGALSIYHFGWSMTAIDESLALCPNLRKHIAISERRKFRKLFNCHFPNNMKPVRDSIGHAAAKARNPRDYFNHAFTGRYKFGKVWHQVSNFVVVDDLTGRKFSNSWQGKIVSYRINNASYKKLVTIKDGIYAEFDLAYEAMRGL